MRTLGKGDYRIDEANFPSHSHFNLPPPLPVHYLKRVNQPPFVNFNPPPPSFRSFFFLAPRIGLILPSLPLNTRTSPIIPFLLPPLFPRIPVNGESQVNCKQSGESQCAFWSFSSRYWPPLNGGDIARDNRVEKVKREGKVNFPSIHEESEFLLHFVCKLKTFEFRFSISEGETFGFF